MITKATLNTYPRMPSSKIPDHISGIANDRCDCNTKNPIPFVLATISEMTIRISGERERAAASPRRSAGSPPAA